MFFFFQRPWSSNNAKWLANKNVIHHHRVNFTLTDKFAVAFQKKKIVSFRYKYIYMLQSFGVYILKCRMNQNTLRLDYVWCKFAVLNVCMPANQVHRDFGHLKDFKTSRWLDGNMQWFFFSFKLPKQSKWFYIVVTLIYHCSYF